MLASSQALAGHPVWHFGVVAGAGIVTFLGIKVSEWRKDHPFRMPGFDPRLALLSVIGLACSGIHAFVCPEHFREWIVYGVFFMCASAVQAAWSILVLVRPSKRLLLAGALGNAGVIVIYFVSRLVGIPFGPDALRPETYDTLSMVATACEAVVVALAVYLASARQGSRGRLGVAISRG